MNDTTRNLENNEALLSVDNLKTSFFTPEGEVEAVNGVSFHVNKGEIIAIVGESGCGKSVTQMSIMQLIPTPPGKICDGKVLFEGHDLLSFSNKEMRHIRGADISMIFQEPMTSLNPVLTIGEQLSEVIRTHTGVNKAEARKYAIEALDRVGIPEPKKRMSDYPFHMSGGMRQRVMIAIAIACKSKLIIADEPTTALDVTTQAQVMELLVSVVNDLDTSLIIITHNLGLVTRYAERIYVMYAGRVVESGTTEDVMTNPQHPYTIGLLNSVPKLEKTRGEELIPIKGSPPKLISLPEQCSFLPRCPYAEDKCKQEKFPDTRTVGGNEHRTACHLTIGGNK